MWVDVIKTKDQACEAFKKIIQRAENASGRRVKVLRTDRGGEFLSSIFRDLCDQAGIERQLTAPYSPQQNGVVERKNRTVMVMARSLLKSMNVPDKFWGEAVRHTVYLLNHWPTKALEERTPFEAWTGRKPHLAHLRMFGCLAHVKVTTPYLKKLDDRSQGMVYLGVEEGSKAYRLYDPRKEKLYVSRDVKFEEQTGWCWDVGANAKEEPSFTVEGVFFPEPELEEAESEIESQFPVTTSTQEPVPRTSTRAEVKIPSGPMTRARARAAREAATPLSDNSDE